jgi:hypothetical protein
MPKRKTPVRFLAFTGFCRWPITRTCSPKPFVKFASLPKGQRAAYEEALDLTRSAWKRERAHALLRAVPS